MINRSMKDSGIEWIGKIPNNWKLNKVRYFMAEQSIKNFPNEMVLSLYRDHGIVPKDSRNDNHNVTSLNTSSYKLVKKNNLVINKMKAWQGSMSISRYQGIISPAYYIFSIDNNNLFPDYLNYAFRNPAYIDEYKRISAGIRPGQWDLNKEEFKNLLYALPDTMEEQQKIAAFLDEKVKHIDNILEDTKRSIEILKSYKKSLVTTTVTKGLDPNVEMKDSGIEWVGMIPIQWEINIAKRIFKKEQRDIENDEIITCFRDGEVTLRKNRRTDGFTISTKEIGYQGIRVGDLIIHQMDAFAGAIGVSDSNGKSTPVYIVCTSDEDSNNYYYAYLLRAYAEVGYIESMARGIRERSTDFRYSTFSITPLLVPPIDEQEKIVLFLEDKLGNIDDLIAQKEYLIKDLESYKKLLIYEYVTGKKEVE